MQILLAPSHLILPASFTAFLHFRAQRARWSVHCTALAAVRLTVKSDACYSLGEVLLHCFFCTWIFEAIQCNITVESVSHSFLANHLQRVDPGIAFIVFILKSTLHFPELIAR